MFCVGGITANNLFILSTCTQKYKNIWQPAILFIGFSFFTNPILLFSGKIIHSVLPLRLLEPNILALIWLKRQQMSWKCFPGFVSTATFPIMQFSPRKYVSSSQEKRYSEYINTSTCRYAIKAACTHFSSVVLLIVKKTIKYIIYNGSKHSNHKLVKHIFAC